MMEEAVLASQVRSAIPTLTDPVLHAHATIATNAINATWFYIGLMWTRECHDNEQGTYTSG